MFSKKSSSKHHSSLYKDKKLIQQARQQVSLSYSHATNIFEYPTSLRIHINETLAQHEETWNAMLKQVELAVSRQQWHQVEELASNLLHAIDLSKWNTPDKESLRLSYYHGESTVYGHRATARYHAGNYRKAIHDWTMHDITSTSSYCKMDDETQRVHRRISMFQHRSMCFGALGDFEKAMVDIRASVALARMSFAGSSLEEVVATKSAMVVLATMKRDYPRPHYTPEERYVLENQLRVGVHAKEAVRCDECGKSNETSSSKSGLCLCRGCFGVWYCSRHCQKKSWKSGHKRTCGIRTAPEFILDSMKSQVQDSFVDGVGVATSIAGRELVLCRDPWNGRYFENLTDANVYFLPSEAGMVPKQFESQVLTVMEAEMLRLTEEEKAEGQKQGEKRPEEYRKLRMYYASILFLGVVLYVCLLVPIVWLHDDSCLHFVSPNEHKVICR